METQTLITGEIIDRITQKQEVNACPPPNMEFCDAPEAVF
jgi:hypothetical protein